MPPYSVRREYNGNRRPARAASSRPDRTPGNARLAGNGIRPWRHGGIPPYNVRRECGGNRRPARAAASRPYAALSIRSVVRGAHTPPNQARSHRDPLPFHLVGAASSRPDRTPGTTRLAGNGIRSRRHVGMPPYSVRREYGGNRRPARAAASRPYAALSIRSVGRGAHTPPNQARSHRDPQPFHLVGAASSRPDRTPGTARLAGNGIRPWRHVGMPPYSVRRECSGNRRPARAAASRPYAALSIRSVGRGAHTPPNQARSHRDPLPFHLVGAASSRPDCTPVLDAPPPNAPGPGG